MIKLNKASRLRLATHNAKSILWERNTKKLLSLSVAYFAAIVSMAEAQDMPKTAAEMGIMQGTPPQRTIDISEWDKGPDNRWAFSTSVKLFRLRISEGGQVQPLHFKSHLKTSRGCNFRRWTAYKCQFRTCWFGLARTGSSLCTKAMWSMKSISMGCNGCHFAIFC